VRGGEDELNGGKNFFLEGEDLRIGYRVQLVVRGSSLSRGEETVINLALSDFFKEVLRIFKR